MKKNKGFTLVELLAVIAILAILVIMALPAVLRMNRQSRINTFQNETRSVYRTAQSQFLGDSILLGSGQKILYTNGCNSSSDADVVKSLDMTGNSNFKYYVLIDVDGKVLEVRSSNGTYSYSKTGTDIKVEDIEVETNNEATLDSDINSTICTASVSTSNEPNYLYTSEEYSLGDTLVVDNASVFDNFEYGAMYYGHDVLTAHIVDDDDKIIESYVAFKVPGSDTIYYIKGYDTSVFQYNMSELDRAFPQICEEDAGGYYCNDESSSGIYAYAVYHGYVQAYLPLASWGCFVSVESDNSSCNTW